MRDRGLEVVWAAKRDIPLLIWGFRRSKIWSQLLRDFFLFSTYDRDRLRCFPT